MKADATVTRVVEPMPAWFRHLGALSRRLPYFRGKWRLMDYIFTHFQKHGSAVGVICLNGSVTIKCNLSDEVQNNIWWLGDGYEWRETRFLQRYLQPGMTFIDVGANIGYYSLLCSFAVGPTGLVHAFEPVANQYADLCANVVRNGFTNIVANRLIVSDHSGTMAITLGPAENSGKASVERVTGLSTHTESVEAVTLDKYIGNRPVHVIKIDTEGHELAALRGSVDILRRYHPVILVEVIDQHLRAAGASREQLFDFLTGLGYRAFIARSTGQLRSIRSPEDGKLIVFQA